MSFNVPLIEKIRWRLKVVDHKFQQYRRSTSDTVVLDTEYGKVKGVRRFTVYDEPYYSFEGIPYAQPPVGELRFKAPQRPTPWEGVLDCLHPREKAVQVNFISNKVEGSEDCLYLNVYTDNITPPTARPVLVWIHGGGFIFGEANRDYYGPDYFMSNDVVLVTIQYRLGALGFLSLESPELNVPGNAGLKDQVLALKWIKSNCSMFGGNPECITVFGQSAGGASTHYMMLTEQTQGLFHRAILMAGNALAPWATTDCRKRAITLAKLAGYKEKKESPAEGDVDANGGGDGDKGSSEKDILEFLCHAKAKDLIRLEEKVLSPEELKRQVMFAFGPTPEPYPSADCVLPKSPKELLKDSWSNAIPILVGNNSYEGLFMLPTAKYNPNIVNELESCVHFLPPEVVDPDLTSNETIENGLKLKRVHVTGEKPTVDDYMDLTSHQLFWFPSHRLLQARLKYAPNIPTYLYRFDFDSEDLINPYRIMRWGRGVKGVAHADELSYLFWTILGRRMNSESREFRTIERMVGIWTRFAATGNPYDCKISGLENISWEPVKSSDENYKCLNIGDELKIIDLPEMSKIKAWDSCFDKDKNSLIGEQK